MEPNPSSPSIGFGSRLWLSPFVFVAACFFVSGFAALLYETVWLRQFAILLGTSEQALAVVLASYMGGLASGSLVASRIVNSIRRPLMTYGVLEFGIALAALFVPFGISLASSLQASLFGGQPNPPAAGSLTQALFCLATSLGLILIPTSLMGATLPLLARHVVTKDDQIGPRIGLLYAINTAGAVVGTLCAAFYCLPNFGLARTTWIGVAANILVFGLVLLALRNQTEQATSLTTNTLQPERSASQPRSKRQRRKRENQASQATDNLSVENRYEWILWFAAISGAVSFCYEILFTRMLGHMLGGSVYAFATMLAGFLLGIALGGAIGSRYANSRRLAATGFVYAQAAASLCALATYHAIDRLVVWPWREWSDGSSTWIQVSVSVLALLPTATCIGATFPLAIRVFAKDQSEAASGAAKVYFWNVLGGIVGALSTGAILLPALQYHGAIVAAILCNLLIAFALVGCLRMQPMHFLLPIVGVIGLLGFFPSEPENVIRLSALTGQRNDGEILFHHVGRSATVTVMDINSGVRFFSNGLPESTMMPRGSGMQYLNNGYWLSSLPPLVRPSCKSMMIIGLGGGVAAEDVPPSVETIDVLELEPSIVDANRSVAKRRERDPLSDPRINVVLNDARNALALTDKAYDAIVSQPSHPWTAGASHLYTRQFNELVRGHLNPGGIFLQWMSVEFVDTDLVRSMGATLLEVFPHARLYQPFAGTLLFVASDKPIEPEKFATSSSPPSCDLPDVDQAHYQRMGIVTPTHLLGILSLDEQGLRDFCHGGAIVTDERNLLAMKAPILVQQKPDPTELHDAIGAHTPAKRGQAVMQELCPTFDSSAFFQQTVNRDSGNWLIKFALPLVADPAERVRAEAKLRLVAGDADAWSMQLLAGAQEFPDSSNLAFDVLSRRAMGRFQELKNEEAQQFRSHLNAKHKMVLQQIENISRGDIMAAREHDEELAAIGVDDPAFEMALRVRIPWRLESPPQERVARCLEVIEMIDAAPPFANAGGISFFRASAAVRANQPHTAIATIQQSVRQLEESLQDPSVPPPSGAAANLMRCYSLFQIPGSFHGVPDRTRRLTQQKVESLLQALSAARSQ